MKRSKLMLSVLCAAAFTAAVSVSCSEISMIEIDAPADLQSKIDSIAAANNVDRGDTTTITINTAIVGAEDCSSGWWGAFSDCFEVPANKLLHFEFVNHSSKGNNWNNWNLLLASTEGHSTDDNANYSEYFVLRSDAYGWGNADYASALIQTDYFEEGHLADWDEFRAQFMDGAYVTIEVDHSISGYAFVTAKSYNASYGYAITETYNHPVPTSSSVYASLITDGSYFEMKNAYLIPSKIQAVEDQPAVSIAAAGYPAALELGETDYWGNAVATVTFADGTSAPADTADIAFEVIPDLTTIGQKTVIFSYSKTKQGNYGPAVVGHYTINMTNPIVGIEAEAKVNLIGGAKTATLSAGAVKVTATYGDGSKAPLASSQFTVEFADNQYVFEGAGTYEKAFTASMVTSKGETLTAEGNVVAAASSQPAQTAQVGASDFSTGWWVPEGFSRDWNVAPYESEVVEMTLGSDNLGNWHSVCTVLRAADLTEYAVVRQDHFGWGAGYGVAVASSNWNWDYFASHLNGSKVAITVTNCGDGTANIRYTITDSEGEPHFQYYDGIAVTSEDLTFANIVEEGYLIYE